MPTKTTATTSARDRLAAVEEEHERLVADLAGARDRVKALRQRRLDALAGDRPDTKSARAVDQDLAAARADVTSLEDLLEDLHPVRLELQAMVRNADMAEHRAATAEAEIRRVRASMEIAQHMAAIAAIADQHGAYTTPFSRSVNAVCKTARSSTWRTFVPDELARRLARAEAELAELRAR